jgi:hypothetical protein
MKILIDIKNLIFITLGFVMFTAIGTVSHEFGHIIIAKSLGYETTLHYGSMNYKNSNLNEKINEIYTENKIAIENKSHFDKKTEYEQGIEKLQSNSLLITIGGPLQTTLAGTIGLFILFYRRKKISEYKLKLIDWFVVFLSLFWLREVFNVVISIIGEIITSNGSYFGGDEKYISDILNLWDGTISSILGIIGLTISIFIVFKVVPKQLRLTFILGGFLGGIFGFILWMNILGPKILP